jgi:creatinine deaminase
MTTTVWERNAEAWMEVALAQAEAALAAGDAPVGAAIFDDDGRQLAVGRNREASTGDRFLHAEIDAIRALGTRQNGSGLTLVTTVGPCWSCSGTIRFFGIPRLIVGLGGDHVHGARWLADAGADVLVMDVPRAAELILPWQEQHFPGYDMLRSLQPGA